MKDKKGIIVMISMLLFVITTVMVVCDATTGLDNFVHSIFVSIKCDFCDTFFKACTHFGGSIITIAITSLVTILLFVNDHKKESLFFLLSVVISFASYYILNSYIARPRPEYLSYIPHGLSYPSGHTTGSFTLYGTLLYLILRSNFSKRIKVIASIICPLLILIVICSRLYLGVHYVTDIMGGIFLSLTVQYIARIIYEERKRKV